MRYSLTSLLCLLLVASAISQSANAQPKTQTRPENGTQLHLWKDGAPGFEDKTDEIEVAQQWWVANIHNPSITAYFPESDKANGTSILVCPGGGHRELVFGPEGVEAAEYLNKFGVTVFVLKYRLGNDKLIQGENPYSPDVHARQDGHRAMRTIRNNAENWGLDPEAIGIMGFSAGAQVAHMVVFAKNEGDDSSADPIEKISSRPNFQVIIYPGGGNIPETIPSNTPPAFLLATMEDRGPANTILNLAEKYRAARSPVEIHLFSLGAHGFNMGNRSKLHTIHRWPERLTDWMHDSGLLGDK